MTRPARTRMSVEELLAEEGTALPAKEVISLLDLNVDLDLALALAAPIDLAVAANAQVGLPINASVSANILGLLSSSAAVANQGVLIDQVMDAEALADATQTAAVDQTDEDGGDAEGASFAVTDDLAEVGDTTSDLGDAAGDLGDTVGEAVEGVADAIGGAAETLDLSEGLLNVDVNVDLDADIAAPIAGAVAANAQVAAPINASVAANIGTVGSEAIAIAEQTAVVTQVMEDVVAEAIVDQDAAVDQ